MADPALVISEIFHSLQGETSLTGVRFAFVRLTGCNLRCTYCDSAHAFHGGNRLRISEIISRIAPYQVRHVLITGGEPLLQTSTPLLVQELGKLGYLVSIETHGEVSIADVVASARIVMDIKTPSSKIERKPGQIEKNLELLKPTDEIKFVIASKEDYLWAKDWVTAGKLPTHEVLFSAAIPALNAPGTFSGVSEAWLAGRIVEDCLPVRFQIQLHKHIWGNDTQGV